MEHIITIGSDWKVHVELSFRFQISEIEMSWQFRI